MAAFRLDLKVRLALRVAGLTALCLVAAAAYMLVATHEAVQARADRIAEIVARDLALQQEQMHWVRVGQSLFPDLQRVALALAAPGLCIAYRTPDGTVPQRLCSGAGPDEAPPPPLFAQAYARLFDVEREAVHPIRSRGMPIGEAVVSVDRHSLIAEGWRETSRLGAVMGVALLALCILVYAALADALRPTRAIRAGLAALAAGDLSTRLPDFDLAELSAVGRVFNDLGDRLQAALAERNALMRQLIEVQDEERRHLARELHDEFGQCLAAIGAVAASAGQTAAVACPDLVPDCRSIGTTTTRMMEALRGTLLRLRPPEIEELGLAASLEGLVAGWNARTRGTRFSLDVEGDPDSLPEAMALGLYRVAQEAITNAAKHARATRVSVRLVIREDAIELTVGDDGATSSEPGPAVGMGLLGMRERVAMLGGQLRLQPVPTGGLVLLAAIPRVPERSA